MSNGCLSNGSNPVLWKEKLPSQRKGQTPLTVMTLVNAVAAAVVIGFMHDRLTAATSTLLPMWEWWTLAALMAGTAYHSLTRIRLERTRGTLELLRSTPLIPRALLLAQVRLALGWVTRALPLLALWVIWMVSAGPAQWVPRAALMIPLVLLLTIGGSLVGVRLALAPQGSNWTALGGGLALAALVFLPAGIDAVTGQLQTLTDLAASSNHLPHALVPGYGLWNLIGVGGVLGVLTLSALWLWSADIRALSGYELNQTSAGLDRRMRVPALWRAFDRALLTVAHGVGLDANPFFMRERARSLRKLGRQPGIVLTALVPACIPMILESLLGLTPGVALAWCAVPIIFMWWMAGAETTRDALTRELDARTLDTVRVTPIDPHTALMGMVFGRLYPFVIGWLTSLPLWAVYMTQPGVHPLAVAAFVMVLLGVGFTSAVGGLRASCTSLSLKGEDRYYSQAVSNPGLWAWPVATPLLVLFGVLPLHPVLEAMGLISHFSNWVPFDVVTLFPTWFSNPELLPAWTFMGAVVVHAIVMRMALRSDLSVAWDSVQKAMNEEIRKAAA